MALNYSHRPLFQPHVSEDNLVSPIWSVSGYFVEGNPGNCWEAYGRSCHMRQGETESWSLNSMRDRVGGCSSPESTSKDIVDLLPADPFGMDMDMKTTVTVITGLLEDLHGDYGEYIMSNEIGTSQAQDNCGLFFPWNLIWNNTFKAQPKVDNGMKLFPGYHVNEELESCCFVNSSQSAESLNSSSKMAHVERDTEGGALDHHDFMLTKARNAGDVMRSNNGISSCSAAMQMQFGEVDNGMEFFPSYHVNEELESHRFMNSSQSAENLNVSSNMDQHVARDIEGALDHHNFNLPQTCNVGDIVGSSKGIICCSAEVQMRTGEVDGAADFGDIVGSSNGISCGSAVVQMQTEEVDCAANTEEAQCRAFRVAFRYLGVKELLSMERVCKSLYSITRGDRLLWCSIHIDQPLNEKITDDVLVGLASRAQGDLQCLSLVECLKVTVDGLRRVLETNPRLTKLCVPGCTRLSIDGILDLIRTHNSREGVLGIKLVRISGLNVVKSEQFADLKSILAGGNTNLQSSHCPHYYRWGSIYLPCDDARAIDVEMCPRCEKIRMVYDCPAEGCRAKDGGAGPPCRACKICIPRCDKCGTCIDERVFEETFCLDVLCLDCFRQLVRQEDEQTGPQGAAVHESQVEE